MCAVSLAKFTVALTPSKLLSARSIEFTHALHVIPSNLSVRVSSESFVMRVPIHAHFR